MKYDVYGNVYKKTYIKECYFKPLDLEGFKYEIDLAEYNDEKEFYFRLIKLTPLSNGMYSSYRCIDLRRQEIARLKECLLEEIDKKQYNSKSFVRYALIKTIDTDREFKDGDLFTYNNNDYKVIYKYNSDKDRHELYINYTCELIIDGELDNKINKLIEETNELIKNHNGDIEKQIKEIIKEPKIIHEKIQIPIENQSWFTKLINKIKGVK